MLPSLIRSCRIRRGCSRERCIEVVVDLFEQTADRLEMRSCLRGRRNGLRVIARMKARLHLANPIPAGDQGRTGLEMLLEATFVEPVVAIGAELPRKTP